MQYLKKGTYFGEHRRRLEFENLIITDTEYTHDRVDWHYHQNVYFTYLLKGRLLEANKKESYNCSPGSLLFHNWQEPHYNIKYPGYARGFHIEIESEWFAKYDVDSDRFQGSIDLSDPIIRNLINSIYRESKLGDDAARITINGILLQIFGRMMKLDPAAQNYLPDCVKTTAEIIQENFGKSLSLAWLAAKSGIHPVYLSYVFQKHLKITIGQFIRRTRVDAAKELLNNPDSTLTEISSKCGFSDQSHFNRVFKSITGLTPGDYRRKLIKY